MPEALSSAQQEAIRHRDGPAIVLAGPGSGKTTVITWRVRHLLTEEKIPGSRILVITFTRAAAGEMKERFMQMMSGDAAGVTFGTFHSVFYRILRAAYNYDASNILTSREQQQIIRELVADQSMEVPDISEFSENLLSEISSVKSNSLDIGHYYPKSCAGEVFRKVYAGYEEKLRSLRKVDFDDILTMTVELFEKRPDILKAWQDRFPYLLIDEFQDINAVQYRAVRLLAGKRGNLFIVGDDDQSIYRFRGARPEIMLGFEKDYPRAKRILLDINYRSDANIVSAAGNLIRNNKARFSKEIRALKPASSPVTLRICADAGEQNRVITDCLRAYAARGIPYEDMAILFRTNPGIRLVMDALMKTGIPFHVRDSLPNLFMHWISLDILACLKIAAGLDGSRAAWLRIINRPNRYIRREALQERGTSASCGMTDRMRSYYRDKPWMLDRIDKLEYDLRMVSQMTPYAAIHYFGNVVRYREYLAEYAAERHMAPEDLSDIFDAVLESSRGCQTLSDWLDFIEEYSQKLKSDALSPGQVPGGVCLSTMHSAKGLEYRIVLIPDINEDNIPHNRASLAPDIEEERRLFYVGMTRAKEHLHLFCLSGESGRKKAPSHFLSEIDRTLVGRIGEKSSAG